MRENSKTAIKLNELANQQEGIDVKMPRKTDPRSERRLDAFTLWKEGYASRHGVENLTLKMIAEKASIHESTLSRKIRGEREFTEMEVLALADIFGITWAPCYNFGQKAKETPRSEIACLPD